MFLFFASLDKSKASSYKKSPIEELCPAFLIFEQLPLTLPMSKEATARIKINKLLEEAGWRFFDDEGGPANILLENYVKITQKEIDAWGNDYEQITGGSLDFLLFDSNNQPICVLEAKKESLHPLVAKEQARKYANSVGAQYIILSNGIVHYQWDLKKGNPKTYF